MVAKSASAYEQVTRQMVLEIKTDISGIKESVSDMTNHYSKRLPTWATVAFAILTAIVGGLISKLL